MKMQFTFVCMTAIVMICSLQLTTAQNTSPYWSQAGNSNATATSKLGTTNSIPLNFYTNNGLRMVITPTGNVGIGNNNPTYKLYVNGANNGIWGGGAIYGVRGNGGKYAVYGGSVIDTGVYGKSSFTATTAVGVYGTGYYGVKAAGNLYGLYAASASGGTGVHGAGGYYGVYGTGTIFGVYGTSTGSYGVYGYASASNSNGVYGYSAGTSGYGVYGYGSGHGIYGISSTTGRGVYGRGLRGVYAECNAGGAEAVSARTTYPSSYAVTAVSSQSIGIYAYTGNAGSYAGYFVGNILCSGSYLTSDERLKKNINTVDNALDIINRLQPKFYQFRNDGNYAKMNLPAGNHYGLLAQDVEKVLPQLVKESQFDISRIEPGQANTDVGEPISNITSTDAKTVKNEVLDFKAVNYVELIPILVKSVQELSQAVDKLSKENAQMKEEIWQLKNGKAIGIKADVFTDKALLQNSPNPFSNTTTISYVLPEKFSKAQILINDQSGKAVKQINLSGGGKGSYNVAAGTLSSGTYNYSLVVDGAIIHTKQLVIAK
jgi:Chaperone of endosialidase